MGIHSRAVATAKRLIYRHGRTVTWRRFPAPIAPPTGPATPWKPTDPIPVDESVRIVFLPKSNENQELLRYLKGSDITIGSLQGLMPVVDFEPSLKDIVIDSDGKQLNIKAISPLKPGNEIIFYTIEFEV